MRTAWPDQRIRSVAWHTWPSSRGRASNLGIGHRLADVHDVTSRTPSSALVLTLQGFKRFLKSVPDFKERLQEFSDMRRRAWELECGLDLDVGQSISDAESSPVNRLEAALLVQAGMRSMLARRKWTSKKELQDLHNVEEAEAAFPAVQ